MFAELGDVEKAIHHAWGQNRGIITLPHYFKRDLDIPGTKSTLGDFFGVYIHVCLCIHSKVQFITIKNTLGDF